MNLGGGIVLVAVGAILAFAVNHPGGTLDISVVGWILMATGGVVIRLDLLGFSPRRRAIVVTSAVTKGRLSSARGAPLMTRAPIAGTEWPARSDREGAGHVRGAAEQPWAGDVSPP
ncbi:MAG: hypothetical protein QOF53_983 [Nocardioidaceae bacterium]|jgi:hypothetical protein|nr:hypothetical protein [Nocardioidaceae bacterium]